MRGYYAARPALPRPTQLAIRRAFSRIQARSAFPRWPVEPGLHDLYTTLFGLLAETLGGPLPALASWPGGKGWALVLTHDVEHEAGYRAIAVMRELEARARVPVGVVPRARERLPRRRQRGAASARAASRWVSTACATTGATLTGRPSGADARDAHVARRWGAVGFRAPATHRSWKLMPTLGFDYDSSSFDTDPFEPQSGGCCTWLPFTNGELVELPLTLTMDHTVFVILRRDASLWVEKADVMREHGGIAVLLTHPDYMLDSARLAAYEAFLERYEPSRPFGGRCRARSARGGGAVRASSIVEAPGGHLRIDGPAADEARIVMLGGRGAR